LGHVLSDFAKSEQAWVDDLCRACAEALPLLAQGQDEKYQTEVARLAPAAKLDPRAVARGE
jgi:PTH1 family peptidyl-tRNA hydrolase